MSNAVDSEERLTILDFILMAVAVVVIASAVIGWFVLPPIVAIWSLNTLFPGLAIPTNSYTVLAALFLMIWTKTRATKSA